MLLWADWTHSLNSLRVSVFLSPPLPPFHFSPQRQYFSPSKLLGDLFAYLVPCGKNLYRLPLNDTSQASLLKLIFYTGAGQLSMAPSGTSPSNNMTVGRGHFSSFDCVAGVGGRPGCQSWQSTEFVWESLRKFLGQIRAWLRIQYDRNRVSPNTHTHTISNLNLLNGHLCYIVMNWIVPFPPRGDVQNTLTAMFTARAPTHSWVAHNSKCWTGSWKAHADDRFTL